MKKHKEFDCVQMKWDIQQRLLKKYSSASPKQIRSRQQDHIAADPLLGPFLRNVATSSPTSQRIPK